MIRAAHHPWPLRGSNMLKRRALGLMISVFLFLLSSEAAVAQVGREEFEALKAETERLREAIKSQTEALKQLLERTGSLRENREPSFREVLVNVDGAAFYGKSDAKVTIVEFSDYQCPFCARYALDTFPHIDREYIQTGRVRYVVRDFPIESIHPQAFKAHEAVHCAGEQGKRWEMHEKVFSNQRAMSTSDLTAHAQSLGLEMAGFQKCLASGSYAAKVRRSLEEGIRLGVRATPTFFVGLTEANKETVKATRRIIGAQPYPAFKAAIDELLSASSPPPNFTLLSR